MFISQAYYCYHIHKEKVSNPETENSKTNNQKKGSYNIFKNFNKSWGWVRKKEYSNLFKSF